MKLLHVWMSLSMAVWALAAYGQEAAEPAPGPDAIAGNADLAALKQQVKDQQENLENLDKVIENLRKEVEALQGQTPSWINRITLKGDFRYRHDMIDVEGSRARHRNRFRLRYGLEAEVNEHLDFGLRFISGTDDPISGNQTLGDGFSSKQVELDHVYGDFHPKPIPNLHLIFGKMTTMFYRPGKAELYWDADLSPEGAYLIYSHDVGNLTLFTTLGGFWVEERSDAADSGLFAAQGGIRATVDDTRKLYLMGGSGFFNYTHTAGNTTFVEDDEGFGNTTVTDPDGNERYVYDYGIFQLFAEAGITLAGVPFSVFGDLAINTATGASEKTGWLVGTRIGSAKKPGSWGFRYNYRKVEADSMIAAFTDSDFSDGGTDAQGHEIGVEYIPLKNTKIAVTWFPNERNLRKNDPNHEEGFHRVFIDFSFKF
ncbi:MAG: putative porin [Phycisphaerales bacterium]|nr:MAG: putative porin [Phycisphaerales bacterium]